MRRVHDMKTINLPLYTLEKNALKDKTILITGASRGLGREIALKAAEYGATTILLGSSLKKLESVYDVITENGWPEPALQPMNFLGVGPKELEALANSIESMFGKLDGLVHNAASVGQVCPLEVLPAQKWLQSIHVNLNIPFMLTHALLPLLHKSTQSSVIFTADNDASQPQAYWGAYHASKMGLKTLAETFMQELESTSIKVNTVYPPHLRTALRINHFPGINPAEFTAPEAVAADYVYLLQSLHHGQHFGLSAHSTTGVMA